MWDCHSKPEHPASSVTGVKVVQWLSPDTEMSLISLKNDSVYEAIDKHNLIQKYKLQYKYFCFSVISLFLSLFTVMSLQDWEDTESVDSMKRWGKGRKGWGHATEPAVPVSVVMVTEKSIYHLDTLLYSRPHFCSLPFLFYSSLLFFYSCYFYLTSFTSF